MTTVERLLSHGRIVADLIRRVQAGKILNGKETDWIERVCNAGEPLGRGKPRERRILPIYDSMSSCAAATGIPLRILKMAKRAGCPAFQAGNRINLEEFLRWRFAKKAHEKDVEDWSGEVRREDALMRRLKRERAAGLLVTRAWVAERIRYMCGELNALEVRSEAQHPVRLAGAGADVAQNRACLRGIWEDIRRMIQTLGAHLEDEPET